MSSSVFFKFKSQKEPSRVAFDGTGISVFELKRAIIEINRLGDGTDFDLAIYSEDSNEEYDDDTTIIPRSTSISARRLPPARAGRGSAARYVSGKMPVNALNSSRVEKAVSKAAIPAKPATNSAAPSLGNGAQTEEERIAAMFKAGAEHWDKQQEEMSHATPVFRNSGPKGKTNNVAVPSHAPPDGYICYRCGEKGHWIQECPTNNDPNFDGRPRVKRTTGIPRSFLKTIEKPAALTNDGLTDTSHQPSGVMVNAEGQFVVAEPDRASWEQYQAKTKISAAAQEAAKSGSKELQDQGLECPIDKKLFVEPTMTPCCSRTYCNDCVTNALIESDFTCPGCQRDAVLIDDLKPDDEASVKVKKYLEEKERAKKAKEQSRSPEVKAADVTLKPVAKDADGSRKNSPSLSNVRASTNTPTPAASKDDGSKKRRAEDELSNQRIPQGPLAMRKSNSNPGQQANGSSLPTDNIFGQTNGFPPNMPFDQQGFNNAFLTPGLNPTGLPNGGFMGMPTSMAPLMGMDPAGMMNPMMMMNGFGQNGMGGGLFPQQHQQQQQHHPPMPQQNGSYGGYNGNMMPNGGYGGFNPSGQMNGGVGMNMNMNNMNHMNTANGMPPGVGPNGIFPNQQRNVFNEPPMSGEDNAYFRKPVNPHRHQARQRRVRPSDYREL
ncbi:MAG: hypothetical protein M1825_003883 [Sarcosagium campestre]|nr:MAG: hypothetical protein M1825_003883 [Sarcosagium campestre]